MPVRGTGKGARVSPRPILPQEHPAATRPNNTGDTRAGGEGSEEQPGVNELACRLILDKVCQMMLHSSSRQLTETNGLLTVTAQWHGLSNSQPRLTITILGLAPLRWDGPQPGFLPNTNSDFREEPWSGMICPDCGQQLVAEGGCVVCKGCGYDRCG